MNTNTKRTRALKALTHAVIVSIFGESPERRPEYLRKGDLDELEADLVQRGLDMAVMGSRPDAALDSLRYSGVLVQLVPEFERCFNFGGGSSGHKALWNHVKQVVRQAPPKLTVRWAAVFHDVGKPQTVKVDGTGVSFHGHEHVSARIFRRTCESTVLFPDRDFRDRVMVLITNLGQVEQYRGDWSDSAVRRLYLKVGDAWQDLLDLGRADVTTKHQDKRERLIGRTDELDARVREILRQDRENKSVLPKGIGTFIIQYGYPPGPEVGQVREEIEQLVRSGELAPNLSAEEYVKSYVRMVSGYVDV